MKDLFDTIAPRYDRTNKLISLGLDGRWQHKMARFVQSQLAAAMPPTTGGPRVLDVACGTGNLTKRLVQLPDVTVVGVDPSQAMLQVARQKLNGCARVSWKEGVAEALPFDAATFDVVTVSYGVRNFDNRLQAFREIKRVLKPHGLLCFLEFSVPKHTVFTWAQRCYIHCALPVIGALSTGRWNAYDYLRRSVEQFPQPDQVNNELAQAGLSPAREIRFFPSVAVLFSAHNPS